MHLAQTCAEAARDGDLERLKTLRASGKKWDSSTCYKAAAGGHLHVLRWAHSQGCPCASVCSGAASGGHLEVLQWARANQCPWNVWTCASAAEAGHLKVLQWAREHGCPWDEWTCHFAAQEGHLEVLQWAYSRGCPWNNSTCTVATRKGHLEVLQWAREHGCQWDELTCVYAAQEGHLHVLQWAHSQGCPWDPAIFRIHFGNYVAVIQEYLYLSGTVPIKEEFKPLCQGLRRSMLEDRRLSAFSECMSKRPEDIEQAELARFHLLSHQVRFALGLMTLPSVLRCTIVAYV